MRKLNFTLFAKTSETLADTSLTIKEAIAIARVSDITLIYAHSYYYKGEFRYISIVVDKEAIEFECKILASRSVIYSHSYDLR